MAKKSMPEKAERMLKFLLALKKRPVARALGAHGFKQATLDTGWGLFREAVGTTFDEAAPPPADPKDLVLLDDWENRWYPIASATLEANFPDVHAKVFLNLSQTQGAQLVPNLTTLIGRIEGLEGEKAGDADKAARALLVERGLTADRIGEAKAILARLETLEPEEEADEEPEEPDTASLDRMWLFYKEWSTIARTAIKSRMLLKSMGFLESEPAAAPAAPAPVAEPAAPLSVA